MTCFTQRTDVPIAQSHHYPRQVLLAPLLQKRGLQFIEMEAGNFELPAFPGLIVKESYWRWPQRNLAGNTIDFFVQVLGMTFHNAMRQITGS